MSRAGVQLAARFSLATNRRNFCGPAGASDLFLKAIRSGSGIPAARDALLQFEALSPYLTAIAAKHGRDPLDEEVVEAYWIGNDLLDAFTREDYARILRSFASRGLPPILVERLVAVLPDGPIPHHMFHVAFVGVGAVTGKVPTNLENMERCRPGWGHLESVGESELDLEVEPLARTDGGLALGRRTSTRVVWDRDLLPDPVSGDVVATHWDLAVLRLTKEQQGRLRHYTQRALKTASAAYTALPVP